MRLIHIGMSLVLLVAAMSADTVTLKDGRVITGTYLGGSPRQLKIEAGDQIQSFNIADVTSIEFRAMPERRERATPPRAAGFITLSAGTNLVIRMIDGVDSERNSVGQTFAASLDEPVMIDGQTVIPRGADAVVKLVDEKESGKLTGRATLTLDLVSIKVNGHMLDINSGTVTEQSSSRGARTAKVAGGTALLGTVIGAIAGGGKGAAIGLGSGAAVGAGAQIATKGERVRVPSETQLTFRLETAVRI